MGGKDDRGEVAHDPKAGPTGHLKTLDGLRGVAAIAVVILHAQALLTPIALPRAYLAVDLFFMLSGLVLARAYGARFDAGLDAGSFMVSRFARLYPLYLLGTLLGLLLVYSARLFGNMPWDSAEKSLGSIVAAIAMLPDPFTLDPHGRLTPFNIPAWSLMFEMLASLALVVTWRRLSDGALAWVVASTGAALIVQTLWWGGLDVGSTWNTAPLALLRTAFSFYAGVALNRFVPRRSLRGGAITLILPVIVVALFAPANHGAGGFYDLACAIVVFPVVVYLGASCEPPLPRLYGLLGLLSFPLYAVHAPLLLATAQVVKRTPALALVSPWFGLAIVAGLLGVAWLADRWWDVPVRSWLTVRLSRTGRRGPRRAAREA